MEMTSRLDPHDDHPRVDTPLGLVQQHHKLSKISGVGHQLGWSVRLRFIDPIFEAFGWDVADLAGLGARREVVLENRHHRQVEVAGLDEWDDDLSAEELATRSYATSIPDTCSVSTWPPSSSLKQSGRR